MPIPREWDSQKAVQIESITPAPESISEDQDYGNKMAYFRPGVINAGESREFTIQYSFVFYETHARVDPEKVGSYDQNDPIYLKYTANRVPEWVESYDPVIQKAASDIVGSEKNSYMKARRIYDWIVANIEYKFPAPWGAKDTYLKRGGDCGCYTALFCAMCISQGIPARAVSGLFFYGPFPRTFGSKGSSSDPSAYGSHAYAEFYLPDYGWIPVDGSIGRSSRRPDSYFGGTQDTFLISSKGFGTWTVPPVGKIIFFLSYAWWFSGTANKYDSYYTYTVEETTTRRTTTNRIPATTTPTSTIAVTTTPRGVATTMPGGFATTQIIFLLGAVSVAVTAAFVLSRKRRQATPQKPM